MDFVKMYKWRHRREKDPVYCRMRITPIVVRVWDSDFGVASGDPECLQILAIFKFNEINIKVRRSFFPQWPVPSIYHNQCYFWKGPQLVKKIASLCKNSLDATLTRTEANLMIAYKNYFAEQYAKVFLYDQWINIINFECFTRPWYRSASFFPFGYFYVNDMRKQAQELFEQVSGPFHHSRSVIRRYKAAALCLKDFASLLEKDGRIYLMGNTPTSLDALVYGYLAVTLNMPVLDKTLQDFIKEHNVLLRYVKHIDEKYFSDVKKTYKHIDPIDLNYEFMTTSSLLVAGLFVSVTMFLYALNIGLVKLEDFTVAIDSKKIF